MYVIKAVFVTLKQPVKLVINLNIDNPHIYIAIYINRKYRFSGIKSQSELTYLIANIMSLKQNEYDL